MAVNKKKSFTYLLTSSPIIFKKAFTLAEVLITLGIIGIVAALTVPSLVQKYQEKETVTKLKKAYTVLSQSYIMAEQEYGPIENWGLKNTDNNGQIDYSGMETLAQILAKNMKVAKWCKKGEVCTPNVIEYYRDGTIGGYGNIPRIATTAFYLQDGTIISMGNVTDPFTSIGRIADIMVRLRNNKSVTRGKDIFYFYITKNGVIPSGYDGDTISPFDMCMKKYGNYKYGHGCTAWVIYNENMDYLHCDDLSWNGKTKCK